MPNAATRLITLIMLLQRRPNQKAVELESCREVRESAPSAYGVFNVVYGGELVTYHWLGEKDLRRFFAARLEKDDAE